MIIYLHGEDQIAELNRRGRANWNGKFIPLCMWNGDSQRLQSRLQIIRWMDHGTTGKYNKRGVDAYYRGTLCMESDGPVIILCSRGAFRINCGWGFCTILFKENRRSLHCYICDGREWLIIAEGESLNMASGYIAKRNWSDPFIEFFVF